MGAPVLRTRQFLGDRNQVRENFVFGYSIALEKRDRVLDEAVMRKRFDLDRLPGRDAERWRGAYGKSFAEPGLERKPGLRRINSPRQRFLQANLASLTYQYLFAMKIP
jgi:hypothetical protein